MNHPLVWDDGDFAATDAGANVPGDQHPAHVSFSASPAAPQPGQAVTLTYTGYADPDGELVRWQWDLDGDGSLETTTTSPTVTHVYPSAGTVTVGVRAIDDGHEPSATAEQAITIAPAAAGGPGATSPGPRDTTAPRATRVKLVGLKLSFRTSERASATATLRARGKAIARGSAKARSATITIRLRLTAAGRGLLPRGHRLRARLTLTLRDASGNHRLVKRKLTVRRA